jgi:hypothetical protein
MVDFRRGKGVSLWVRHFRHARACPAHPVLMAKEDVDGRDKHGHDGKRDIQV